MHKDPKFAARLHDALNTSGYLGGYAIRIGRLRNKHDDIVIPGIRARFSITEHSDFIQKPSAATT